jgi:hypothetical protein
MEQVKMSLCRQCTNCPEVEIIGDEVRIGEAGNLAVLKKDEWNILVGLVHHPRHGTTSATILDQRRDRSSEARTGSAP